MQYLKHHHSCVWHVQTEVLDKENKWKQINVIVLRTDLSKRVDLAS